ncbi:MAG: M48 family metallopeptidase [Gammaproteobacteria bacterium]|nr:M48 family metallopeptidase [Gammaproteobacteria bacterium]
MEHIEIINIHGLVVNLIRKKIKNIYLRLKPPAGEIYISAPSRASLRTIQQFINSRLDWIATHQAQISTQLQSSGITNYEPGDYIYFQGRQYLLNVFFATGQNNIILDDKNNIINLYANRRGIVKLRKNIIYNFYKQNIIHQLNYLLPKWQSKMGVEITGYTLRVMRSRWGSCNITKKHICLNLELAKREPICLEYVLVHELIHFFERKHNKKFYALMSKFMPNWREYEKLLKVII